MKIRLIVNERSVTAKLTDSPTARDFATLLPLTLTMNDLFSREKFGTLPRALSSAGKRTHRYALGEIAYWPPGPDVAVFYRHDGEEIPDPGIIVIGKVTSRLDALNVRGVVHVTFERLDDATTCAAITMSTSPSGDLRLRFGPLALPGYSGDPTADSDGA